MSFDPSSAKLVEETPKPRFNPETARLAESKRAPFNPSNAVAVDDLPNFTIMDFLRREEGPTETSPLTPATPEIGERPLYKSLPADETDIITEQAEGKPVEAIGAGRITLPNVGDPGTRIGEASRVLTGLGEWALNEPLEFAISLHPLGQAAIAAKYGPDIARTVIEDVPKALKGDPGAQGRLAALSTLIGGGKVLKARAEKALVEGKPGVTVESPEWTAERLQMPGEVGEQFREKFGVVEKRNVPEVQPPEVQEQLLPGASETFKEVVGEPASGERAVQPDQMEEIPLGLDRPSRPDPSLATLTDEEFEDVRKFVTQRVEQMEGLYDERALTRQETLDLAKAQDHYDAVELEAYRRQAGKLANEELFHEALNLTDSLDTAGGLDALEGKPVFERLRILVNILQGRTGREGELAGGWFKSFLSRSSDAREVYAGRYQRLRELTKLITRKEPNAIGIEEAAAPVRDVLRSDEVGTQAPSGVPESVNEGGAGVRGNENQATTKPEAEVAPTAASSPSITGIKNARVDEQRAARGLDPLMEPQRKADPVL